MAGDGSALQQGLSNTMLASAGLMPTAWMPNPAGAPPSYCSSISGQVRANVTDPGFFVEDGACVGYAPLDPPLHSDTEIGIFRRTYSFLVWLTFYRGLNGEKSQV